MTSPSRSIANWRVGHVAVALKHSAASAFHRSAPLAPPRRLTVTPQPDPEMMRAVASSLNTSPVPPAGPTLQTLPPRALMKPEESGGTFGRVLVVSPATVVVGAPPATVVVGAPEATVVVGAEAATGVGGVVVVVVFAVLVRREGPPAAVVVVTPVVVVVAPPAVVVVVAVVAGCLLGSDVTHGMLN